MPLRFAPLGAIVLGLVLLSLAGGCQQSTPSSDAPSDSVSTATPESIDPVSETEAVDSFGTALDRFERAQLPTPADSARLHRWSDSVKAKGQSLQRQSPEKARGFYREAIRGYNVLSDSTQIATAVKGVGVTYFLQSSLDEALEWFEKSLQIERALGHQEGIAQSLNNIGLVHRNQGRFEEALARYREVLQIDRTRGDREAIASTLNNIAVTLASTDRYENALDRFEESLRIRRKLSSQRKVAASLSNIGKVHLQQGQYEKALLRQQDALQILRELGDQRGIAITLEGIGNGLVKQGRYEEALPRYQEALDIRQDIDDRKGVASTLNSIGTVHLKQGRYEKALIHHRNALQIERDIGRKQRIAASLQDIGIVHHERGRHEKALNRYRAALDIRQEIGHRSGLTASLRSIGTVHLETGHLSAATDTLSEATRRAEQLRLSATSPDARRSLLSTQIDAYQALMAAHVRSGRPDSALRSVEQARARLLADRLAGTATGDTTFALPSVAELRRTIGPDEAALLYANADSEWPLTAIIATTDTIVARELPESAVRTAVGDNHSTPLARLRRTEGPLTAAVTGNAAGDARQDTAPSLAEVIRLYRYHLTREQADPSIQNDLSQRLHGLLVAPVDDVLADKNELLAVPTGALGYLPLETLQDSSGTYLAEEAQVRYAQSLTVLRQLKERTYPERERPLLAVGGATYAPSGTPSENDGVIAGTRRGTSRVATEEHASAVLRDASRRMEQGKSPRSAYQQLGYGQWPPLYGTKLEVQKLKRATGRGTRLLTGSSASEEQVRRLSTSGELARYRRVHFATHGVAVPEAPALSALILSQKDASDSLAARDGYLTMNEISELDVAADVAVLSACQTGLGRIVAGEGVVSLSHAFLRAGANATLVSQWRVPDWSTQQFMAAVYRTAGEEGTSFAEATVEVKRAFIDGEYGAQNTDPLRWAPFVYYGRK